MGMEEIRWELTQSGKEYVDIEYDIDVPGCLFRDVDIFLELFITCNEQLELCGRTVPLCQIYTLLVDAGMVRIVDGNDVSHKIRARGRIFNRQRAAELTELSVFIDPETDLVYHKGMIAPKNTKK